MNFGYNKDEKSILKEQNIKKNLRNLIGKSLNTKVYIKDSFLRSIPQNKLFVNKLELFLKKTRFIKQEFSICKLVLDIKYYYSGFQNNNLFYFFNNQLDCVLANYFAKFKTTKCNIIKFLSN